MKIPHYNHRHWIAGPYSEHVEHGWDHRDAKSSSLLCLKGILNYSLASSSIVIVVQGAFLTVPTQKVFEDGKILTKKVKVEQSNSKNCKVLTLTFNFWVGILPSSST